MTTITGLFFGMSTIDCIYLVGHPPGYNQKITAERQLICAGGPATNAAITFNNLGGSATLVSCIGRHPLSAIVLHELKTHGVRHVDLDPLYSSVPSLSSILVVKPTGDRSVVSTGTPPVQRAFEKREPLSLAGFCIALFDGRHMDLAAETAAHCRRSGIHTILDGGSWKPGTEALIGHVDTAICSAAFQPPGTVTHSQVLAWLHSRGVRRAAVTRGGEPILALENGTRFEVTPPQPGPVKDTLAAGDIFHGAYAYYLAQAPGGRFSDHLEKAAAVAAQSCTHFGPRKPPENLQYL